jgi:hypothetical protein
MERKGAGKIFGGIGGAHISDAVWAGVGFAGPAVEDGLTGRSLAAAVAQVVAAVLLFDLCE